MLLVLESHNFIKIFVLNEIRRMNCRKNNEFFEFFQIFCGDPGGVRGWGARGQATLVYWTNEWTHRRKNVALHFHFNFIFYLSFFFFSFNFFLVCVFVFRLCVQGFEFITLLVWMCVLCICFSFRFRSLSSKHVSVPCTQHTVWLNEKEFLQDTKPTTSTKTLF